MQCPDDLSEAQFLAALDVIDRTIPDSDLNYENVDPGRAVPLADRAQSVRAGLATKEDFVSHFPLLCNSVESRLFSLSAGYLVYVWPVDSWQVTFRMPPDALTPDGMAIFLLEFGDTLCAYHGVAVWGAVGGLANDQINHQRSPEFKPPHGLPELYHSRLYTGPEIPLDIGWSNYWSPKTVEAMGFSEAEHAKLFYRFIRGKSGSLAFQLTETPLNIDRPGDLDALKAAYAAFPGVGGRDPRFRIADNEDVMGGAA
jgi:hypothetical protein